MSALPIHTTSGRIISTQKRKPVALRAVRPNAGVQASYQRKLDALIDAMQAAVEAAIHTAYLRKPPRLAADEAPAAALRGVVARLGREWQQRFTDFANREGKRFTAQSAGHADRSFAEALREAGFTVRFTMTPEARDVLAATMAEQVNLIRSIPAEYLTQVQGAVMRSVQTGRDLGALTTELQEQFGVTKRRAAFIARDQNNKAHRQHDPCSAGCAGYHASHVASLGRREGAAADAREEQREALRREGRMAGSGGEPADMAGNGNELPMRVEISCARLAVH